MRQRLEIHSPCSFLLSILIPRSHQRQNRQLFKAYLLHFQNLKNISFRIVQNSIFYGILQNEEPKILFYREEVMFSGKGRCN